MVIWKSKEFAQLEHLQLDDDHYIDVKIGDKIVQMPAKSQMQKFNQDGRLHVNGKQYMHPFNNKLIRDRALRTGFEFDPHYDVPPEDTPYYEQAEQTKVQSVDTNRQAIKGKSVLIVPEKKLEILERNSSKLDIGDIQDTDINQFIRETEHELLKKQDVRIQQGQVLKKLEKEVKDAKKDLSNGDSCIKALDEYIGELNRQLVRKSEESKQKERTLKRLQEELGELEMSDMMLLPGQNASNARDIQGYGAVGGRDPPAATGSSMGGTNNTQIIINGNIDGSFNYNGDQPGSSMIPFFLAFIIAMVAIGYIVFR